MNDPAFWTHKKVFLTGHTGFKGAWLSLWLHALGARVTGYALQPPTAPSLYESAKLDDLVDSVIGDVRSPDLYEAMKRAQPDLVIHMAAQPLVRASYASPAETFETNVMGTVRVLEAARRCAEEGVRIQAVLNVTSDKCYENKEWVWGYRETDRLGGFDPYSSSKACSELVTASYRNAFFRPRDGHSLGVAVATARAGNVIGGGDWAADRLIPDCIRSLLRGDSIRIRNPDAIRPWQHVLEPLSGYLLLARKLVEEGEAYAQSWNFGPDDRDAKPVRWIVGALCDKWGNPSSCAFEPPSLYHEARHLKLDCSKAKTELGWQPRWRIEQTLDRVVEWYKAYAAAGDVRALCLAQIKQYETADAAG